MSNDKQYELLSKFRRIKFVKLISAIIIDLVGLATYIIPVVGEGADWIWAPISGLLIYLLFPTRKKMAILGVVEELIPFADFVPSASIAWMMDYVKDKEKTLSVFVRKEVDEEHLVEEILNSRIKDN